MPLPEYGVFDHEAGSQDETHSGQVSRHLVQPHLHIRDNLYSCIIYWQIAWCCINFFSFIPQKAYYGVPVLPLLGLYSFCNYSIHVQPFNGHPS